MSDGEPLIEVRNLVQTIGEHAILKGISITIRRGETLVLLGKSGGGKSVFLRHLIGLMHPVSGEIVVEGTNITGLSERQLGPIRSRVGMLFQDGALFDSMNVYQNVAFPLREHSRSPEEEIRRRVADALALVNMSGQEEKMPANLSGGMRKRVALARVIVRPPDCILYDEPTAGLDPIVSDSINRLIRRLQNQLRITSVVVTHDLVSAEHIADRVALLHEGKIRFYGTLEQMRTSSDPILRNFIEGRSTEEDR